MIHTPLEEAAAAVAEGMAIPVGMPMTEEQVAEFRERFAEAMRPFQHEVIEPDRLTPEDIRSLLRECVTVVAPGETLVLRLSESFTPSQAREWQDALNAGWDGGDPFWPFRVLVVIGEGLGVAQTGATLNEARAAHGLPLLDLEVPGLLPLHPVPGGCGPLAEQEEPGDG